MTLHPAPPPHRRRSMGREGARSSAPATPAAQPSECGRRRPLRGPGGCGEIWCGPWHATGDKLFPLRFLDVPPVSGRRRERRKTRLAAARVREFNEAVYGLNFLAGYGGPAESSNAQNSIQEFVTSDIFDFVDQVPVSSGAFPRPYQPALLSVPEDTSRAPMARDIVSDEARACLDGIERMMRPEKQTILLDSQLGPIVSYVDTVLKRSRRHAS